MIAPPIPTPTIDALWDALRPRFEAVLAEAKAQGIAAQPATAPCQPVLLNIATAARVAGRTETSLQHAVTFGALPAVDLFGGQRTNRRRRIPVGWLEHPKGDRLPIIGSAELDAMMPAPMLTVEDAACIIDSSPETVRAIIRAGLLTTAATRPTRISSAAMASYIAALMNESAAIWNIEWGHTV